MPTLMITGGAGFIGSNFVRFLLEHRPEWHVVNVDALTYSGNPANLRDLEGESRYRFVHANICDAPAMAAAVAEADGVIHFAAESHVDRSIHDSRPFVEANVMGTQVLLDAAIKAGYPAAGKRFLHVSTDEVYGTLPLDRPEIKFTESTPIQPNSPYAASKAASDLLVRAFHETFGLDAVLTRCSNNFGPYQYPEKVIPLFVTNLINGLQVPLYGDGQNVRDWLHVEDHCEAILTVFEKGSSGEVYNIGGNNERSNLELTHSLIELCGRDESAIRYVPDRLGHDRRYAIDAGKLEHDLGWRPARSAWPEALERTVAWYRDHEAWWRPLRKDLPQASAS